MACMGGGSYREPVNSCPDCGTETDADGWALECCACSPTECEMCEWAPCDGSC